MPLSMDGDKFECTVVLGIPKYVSTILENGTPRRLHFEVVSLFNKFPHSLSGQQAINITVNMKYLILRILSEQDIMDPTACLKLWTICRCYIIIGIQIGRICIRAHVKLSSHFRNVKILEGRLTLR